MRILVVGGAGQVGSIVCERSVEMGNEAVAAVHTRSPRNPATAAVSLDKCDPVAVRERLREVHPDAVLDTAALHNVDYCETHPEEAFRVNAEGTRHLAEACHELGSRFLFVSTDFVFGDRGHPPFQETDLPAPVSVYGQSKLAGEEATLTTDPSFAVVRPSVIYSWIPAHFRRESSSGKGINFGTWLAEEVRHGRPVRIVSDQVASPTLADDLAGAILAILQRGGGGIYHAAGVTPTSRFDFSTRLVSRLGLDPRLVTPVKTEELSQKAARPRNSSLRSDRLLDDTGYSMRSLDDQLDLFWSAYSSERGPPPRTG